MMLAAKGYQLIMNIVIDVRCFDKFHEYVRCYTYIYSYSKIQTYMGQSLST